MRQVHTALTDRRSFETGRGEILLNGKSLKESATNIGYMLQHDHLFEWRTIYHNILLGLEIQHTLTAAAKTHARELLKTYGLEKFADSRPSELSGGMRQRAALIRTLILEPDLLLLDEPFSALDYQTRLSVGDDIGQIIRDSGRTAVLVTHDLSEAISLADTIFILSKRPASIARIVPSPSPWPLTPLLNAATLRSLRHTSIFYGRS